MKIQGIQKLTLLDYPEHVACTIFLGGCDFRCPFCHNFELVDGTVLPFPGDHTSSAPPAMDESEFFAFLAKRKDMLDGVAITGGEPCLRRDLPEFIAEIRDKGFKVKLDTNGNHPDMLRRLVDQKLVNYVAMDIKNSPAKYAKTIGLDGIDMDPIMESVELLKEGRVPYEFRTTVIAQFHDAADFVEIGKWIEGADRYFMQPFTFRDTVPDDSLTAPSVDKIKEFREIVAPYVKFADIRGID